MILTVLERPIKRESLFVSDSGILYHIPLIEYKKQILKGNVVTEKDILAYVCFLYAESINKRFELGEEYISKDMVYSFWYARDIIRGRFKQCEDIISKNAHNSVEYAFCVLKDRFELAEEAIKYSKYRDKYEKHFGIKL